MVRLPEAVGPSLAGPHDCAYDVAERLCSQDIARLSLAGRDDVMRTPKKDPRPGAQYARTFYEKWGTVQKAVCLYRAGIAWKGARIGVLLAGSDHIDWRGNLEEDALSELLFDWFIDGQTTLTFSSTAPVQLVRPGTPGSFEVIVETAGTPPSEESGLTLLWPACTNFGTIERMREQARAGNPLALEVLRELLGYAYSCLGLPGWALEAQSAAEADVETVRYGLHSFGLFVRQQREEFKLSLLWNLRERWRSQEPGLSDVFLEWNREWFPNDPFDAWVGLYAAFEHCSLTLVRFGKEYPVQLRQLVESDLFPRRVLAGWEELGLL